ncbi:phosphoglycerate mutase [Paenibacillus baekrokdamisoli]|uniref:Phosphoglycerate mutase n=1 Tax=Paenibacillus baekrokdamisoli TaxID=1712516 RepID=A0A3G9IZR1_9BACL|nr:histidine phosphatase family protein [Paenibacillus baekrokdamisoli]MBB3072829.1 2,3-bisphosphoglycerate-dependent phosphoglycerate mutase [Paenibacillus baekrokdamisoli]BBH24390.1 phosphoglycerate mutase [Paenibacillus baekrokdamisoli]
MKTIIYMVRHAESPFEFGQERTRGLSEEGIAAAKRVARLFTDIDVHYMASSPYTRAKQTIQYIAEHKCLPIVEYEELVERPIKGLDYKAPWDELYEAIRKSFVDKDFALEGGETTRSVQQRSIPIIERILEEQRGNNIVIGTHGNIMTIIMNHYDDKYGFEFWNSTSKPDIYRMTFNQNQLECVERIWK